jgi:hypothetical protein
MNHHTTDAQRLLMRVNRRVVALIGRNKLGAKGVGLFFACFLAACLTVTGQGKVEAADSEPFPFGAVDADSDPFPFGVRDAGYLGYQSGEIGREVPQTRGLVLFAKTLPRSKLITLTTKGDWDVFLGKYAAIDQESGKPLFTTDRGAAEKNGLSPDFEKDALLVLFSKQSAVINPMEFAEIEVFEDQGILRAFAFFGGGFRNAAQLPENVKEPVQGHFYMVAIPKKLAHHSVGFRMARQNWGRVCSKFSPQITQADLVEIPPIR